MHALAQLYVLWLLWTAVSASPILTQNVTRMSSLEQRTLRPAQLFLGKQNVGSMRERWAIFFGKAGTGYSTEAKYAQKDPLSDDKTTMVVIKYGTHSQNWMLIDLNKKVHFAAESARNEMDNWAEHEMLSQLQRVTPRPDWWPQEIPFDSTPQPILDIYYGGPEPDVHDPRVPPRRKGTGGSSMDMAWVVLEELGKRNLYVGFDQSIPEIFVREFNENYIKIWRRRWGKNHHGQLAIQRMITNYPASHFPGWVKAWTDPVEIVPS